MKRYFDVPAERGVMEIQAKGTLKEATAEQIGAQAGKTLREIDVYEYVLLKREYEKDHQRGMWEHGDL